MLCAANLSFKKGGKIDFGEQRKAEIICYLMTHTARNFQENSSGRREMIPARNMDLHKGMKTRDVVT